MSGRLIMLLAVLCALAPSPAQGETTPPGDPPLAMTAPPQSEDPQGDFDLDEVTVRSARDSRDLSQDRASAGTVLLPRDFDDAGDTLAEVLNQETGVHTTRLGGPASFSTLSIRGSTSDQVLVVLDGVPLNSSVGGAVDLSRLPLGSVERIEIYRGTAPLTFGGSAIGGVVSITTRTGRKRQLSLSGGAGSFGAREARGFYAEPQRSWDLSLGLDYSGWEGNFPYLNDRGTRFDPSDDRWVIRRNNAYNQVNTLGKFRLHLTREWSVSVMNWLFHRNQGIPGLGQFETQEGRHRSLDNLSVLTVQGTNLGGIADWSTRLSFRYADSDLSDPLEEIGLAGDDSRDRSLSPSLNSTATLRPFAWWDITGVCQYSYEHFTPSRIGGAAKESERHLVSAGLENGFWIDRIDLLVLPSARLEWAESQHNNPAPTTPVKIAESTQTDWSLRGALVNSSIPDTRLMVAASRSVRFPSLFELFGNSGRVIGNPSLTPERAVGVDGGIVYDSSMLPSPNTLRVELHGFFSDVRGLIQFVQTAQNVAVAENLDRARLWGIESAIRADLFHHVRIQGNYTYLDARNRGNIAARRGKYLPFRPPSTWFLRAEGYSSTIPNLQEASLFFDAQWTAGNALDNANLARVPARLVLNTGFSVELPRSIAKASFTAQNLTDAQTADLVGYPLPGRSYHVLVTMQVL